MSHDELHALVQQLKSEIAGLRADDDEARERLQALVSDLDRRIDDEDDGVEDEALMDSLRESVERFEVEHPRATGIINNILVMLGNIGI